MNYRRPASRRGTILLFLLTLLIAGAATLLTSASGGQGAGGGRDFLGEGARGMDLRGAPYPVPSQGRARAAVFFCLALVLSWVLMHTPNEDRAAPARIRLCGSSGRLQQEGGNMSCRLNSVLNSLPEVPISNLPAESAIVVTDTESAVLAWNEKAVAFLGFAEANIKGEPLWKRLEGGEELWLKATDECRHEGKRKFTISLRRETEPAAAEITIIPMRSAEGGLAGYLAVLSKSAPEGEAQTDLAAYTESLRSLLQERSDELILKNRELERANANMLRLRRQMERQIAQLKAAHDFLDKILNTVPTGVMTVSSERVITSFNNAAEEITGYSAADAIGRECSILQGDVCMKNCSLFAEERTEPITGKKCIIRGKYGHSISIIKNASFLRDSSGSIVGGVESFVDITELSETEKRLRDADGHLQNVLACAVDVAILTTDCEGLLTSYNEGARRLFGWEPQDVLGEDVRETIFGQSPDNTSWALIAGYALGEGRYAGTINCTRKDESPLRAHVTVMPLTNGDGEHYGFVAVSRVRTPEDEKYVSTAEKMTHEILMSMPEPCLMLNDKAVVCCANDAAQRIFDAKVGQQWKPVFDGGEEWFSGDVFKRLLFDNHPSQTAIEVAAGQRIYNITLIPVTSSDIEGTLIVTGRDITESVVLRQQLVHHDKLATIGTLAASVAHEFNNILSGILGYASLARSDSAYVDKMLDVVEKQGTRAAEIAQGLLNFSRRPQDGGELADLRDVADSVLALVARDMEKNNIEIRRDCQSVPKTLMNVGQIEQVLLNLFVNARQAMEKGGVLTVGARRERDNVLVLVTDTGSGMTPEVREKIFEPFFTTKADRDGRQKGTGLGLSVSYNIIKQHRGSIRVVSEAGRGSTFIVALPIVAEGSHSVVHLSRERTAELKREGKTKRILVVDDEAILRSLFREILASAGHEVFCVEQAATALELVWREHFDVVFLDITLAGEMSGIDAFEKIRQIKPEVKIVLATGSMEHAHIQPCIDRADGFLQKPFTMNDLLPLIDSL